jgi:hypothetical protein
LDQSRCVQLEDDAIGANLIGTLDHSETCHNFRLKNTPQVRGLARTGRNELARLVPDNIAPATRSSTIKVHVEVYLDMLSRGFAHLCMSWGLWWFNWLLQR